MTNVGGLSAPDGPVNTPASPGPAVGGLPTSSPPPPSPPPPSPSPPPSPPPPLSTTPPSPEPSSSFPPQAPSTRHTATTTAGPNRRVVSHMQEHYPFHHLT